MPEVEKPPPKTGRSRAAPAKAAETPGEAPAEAPPEVAAAAAAVAADDAAATAEESPPPDPAELERLRTRLIDQFRRRR